MNAPDQGAGTEAPGGLGVKVVTVAVLVSPDPGALATGLVPRLSDRGLLTLGTELGERNGEWARILFLVGFLAVTSTSLLGVAKAEVVVDSPASPAGCSQDAGTYEARAAEKSLPFRGYLLWLTFPPMLLLFIDRPFGLTLVYGVLGAAFMPFLGVTLLLSLNSRRVERGGRSGWLSNVLLVAASALFVVLLGTEVVDRFS